MKCRVRRDTEKRLVAAAAEPMRRVLRHLARNTLLPSNVRAEAQTELAHMDPYTRITQVKNRCTETGRGRGVLRDFGLCRFQFRLQSLAGQLPGVKRASW